MAQRKKPAAQNPGGRPTLYSTEMCDRICSLLIEGHTLRQIGELEGLPGKRTIISWLAKHVEFQHRYARAREMQALIAEDEIIEIADDSSHDYIDRTVNGQKQATFNRQNVERAKLRVEARKWLMSKRMPKRYGDKIDLNHSGAINMADALKAARERRIGQRTK